MTATVTNFGLDTSCTTSLQTGRLVSGVRLVAEAAYRRLSTPRGSLVGGEDEADYGIDLADMIGVALSSTSTAASLPGQIQSELLKDERIETVAAVVTQTVIGPVTSWRVQIACTTALGPFSLVLSVDEVTVTLLGISTTE